MISKCTVNLLLPKNFPHKFVEFVYVSFSSLNTNIFVCRELPVIKFLKTCENICNINASRKYFVADKSNVPMFLCRFIGFF